MRRLLLFFLLVILPFQFAWGAAASYCAHEKAVGAGHFGHHGHQHRANAKADTDSDTAAKRAGAIADDPDCAMCHLGCVTPPMSEAERVFGTPAAPVMALPSLRAQKYRPNRIERPQWDSAV